MVELLVVIAIIGVLIALLLPAVQAAREAARRIQCATHLAELAKAWHTHHNSHSCFPSGGWGYMWIGEPERGTDRNQPGGWCYNVLSYVESGIIRDLGKGLTGDARKTALADRCRRSLPVFICPSRREAKPYPDSHDNYRTGGISGYFACSEVARVDYAVNTGNPKTAEWGAGPSTLAEGDNPAYNWPNPDSYGWGGVCYLRSEIKVSDIEDGTSQTYLLGEKYMVSADYEGHATNSEQDPGDRGVLYCGFNNDQHRSALYQPQQDRPVDNSMAGKCYGSTHPMMYNSAFCDGSVHPIPYSITLQVHQRLASIDDGYKVDLTKAFDN